MSENVVIFAVDDDILIHQLLNVALKKQGYNVVGVKNPTQAKIWLSKSTPDIILMDVILPETTGLDLCRWIRNQEHLRNIPIIVVTSLSDEDTGQESYEVGAVDYVTKPINLALLEEKISKALEAKNN